MHAGVSSFAGAGGVALMSAAWGNAPLWARGVTGGAIGVIPGLAKEVADLAGLGHPSAKDIVWDTAGSVVGAAATTLLVMWVGEWSGLAPSEPSVGDVRATGATPTPPSRGASPLPAASSSR